MFEKHSAYHRVGSPAGGGWQPSGWKGVCAGPSVSFNPPHSIGQHAVILRHWKIKVVEHHEKRWRKSVDEQGRHSFLLLPNPKMWERSMRLLILWDHLAWLNRHPRHVWRSETSMIQRPPFLTVDIPNSSKVLESLERQGEPCREGFLPLSKDLG